MAFFNSLKKFFSSSLLRARIANSQDLEFSNNNLEALLLLKKYENIAKNDEENQLLYYLIRGRLKHKLKQYDEALEDAITVENILIQSEVKLNSVDFLYLKKYNYFLLSKIYLSTNNPLLEQYDEKYKQVDFSSMKKVKLNMLYEQWLPLP